MFEPAPPFEVESPLIPNPPAPPPPAPRRGDSVAFPIPPAKPSTGVNPPALPAPPG